MLTCDTIFAAGHAVVGAKVAMMTRCCINEKSNAVPIVLLADTEPLSHSWMCAEVWGLGRLFRRWEYIKWVTGIIERSSTFTKSADALILPAILATMHRDAFYLLNECGFTRPLDDEGDENQAPLLSISCNHLRQRIEDFEDVMEDALTSFASLYGADWSTDYGCESSVELFERTINRVRRFETKLRDRSQVHIGHLSLEESKKAIELSISQIQEGKRGEQHVQCNKKLSLTGLSQDM